MKRILLSIALLSILSGCAYTSITVNVTANPVATVKNFGEVILNNPE